MLSYLYEVLDQILEGAKKLAANMSLRQNVIVIAGVALAVIVGLFGYRLARVVMGLLGAGVGYAAGLALFSYLQGNVDAFAKMPDAVKYVFGIVAAILLLVLGFAKFSYAMFAAFAFIGFELTTHFISDSKIAAIAGAVVLALLAALLVRFAFILLTSLAGGFIGVTFLAELLPDVKILQIGEEKWALAIAGGAALIFLIFQYLTKKKTTPLF